MCVEGEFQWSNHDEIYSYKKGDTLLVPAALTDFQLSGQATLLEIYIS
jgi:mannose-6-phosphate isomerase